MKEFFFYIQFSTSIEGKKNLISWCVVSENKKEKKLYSYSDKRFDDDDDEKKNSIDGKARHQ